MPIIKPEPGPEPEQQPRRSRARNKDQASPLPPFSPADILPILPEVAALVLTDLLGAEKKGYTMSRKALIANHWQHVKMLLYASDGRHSADCLDWAISGLERAGLVRILEREDGRYVQLLKERWDLDLKVRALLKGVFPGATT